MPYVIVFLAFRFEKSFHIRDIENPAIQIGSLLSNVCHLDFFSIVKIP